VRFETSRTLDAIETRLSLDPLVSRAVVDLAETVFRADFDGGRPAQLLRLGLIIDAVSAYLGDDRAGLYVVAPRGLLQDTALSSNERIVIRRWADDGLVEVINDMNGRIAEIAIQTGLPVVGQSPPGTGWSIIPQAMPGGVGVRPAGEAPPDGLTPARWWRCREDDCGMFGGMTIGRGQPPPTAIKGKPACPRHESPLSDAGARPAQVAMVVRVDGVIRERFTVTAGQPITVGRAPDERDSLGLARWLDERGSKWVSRSHVRIDLTGEGVTVTDLSTNGTTLLARGGPLEPVKPRKIGKGGTHVLRALDCVALYDGVEVGRAGRMVADGTKPLERSVMADAPTISLNIQQ
jgi:hypothetical protein